MKPLAEQLLDKLEEKVPSSWSSRIGKNVLLVLKNGSESRGKLIKVGRNKKGQQALIFSAGKSGKRYVAVKDIKTVKK